MNDYRVIFTFDVKNGILWIYLRCACDWGTVVWPQTGWEEGRSQLRQAARTAEAHLLTHEPTPLDDLVVDPYLAKPITVGKITAADIVTGSIRIDRI